MKHTHGIAVSATSHPHTVEAETIRSLYQQWRHDQAGYRQVCPLWELLYRLNAEYRHLSTAQKKDRLTLLVLTALNDPRGGLSVVPIPDSERRRGDDWW